MKAIGEKLVKLLIDMSFETHPIIVHVFSNGGAFLYQNFSAALENKPLKVKTYFEPKQTLLLRFSG